MLSFTREGACSATYIRITGYFFIQGSFLKHYSFLPQRQATANYKLQASAPTRAKSSRKITSVRQYLLPHNMQGSRSRSRFEYVCLNQLRLSGEEHAGSRKITVVCIFSLLSKMFYFFRTFLWDTFQALSATTTPHLRSLPLALK